MKSSKYRFKVLQRIVLVFSLAFAGLVASAKSSQANISASGFMVSMSGTYQKDGSDKVDIFVTNQGATGNIATCSIYFGYYLGSAKIGSGGTSVIEAWIPLGRTHKIIYSVPRSLSSYTLRMDSVNCRTSSDTYIHTADRSLALIPSDSSQLEFKIIPTLGNDVWGIQLINKSQSPIYTRFDMTMGWKTVNSETFGCTAANEQWVPFNYIGRNATIGSVKYIVVYPEGTQTNETALEFSTMCNLWLEFWGQSPYNGATYSPLDIFALMPAPAPAPAPAAQPVPSVLTFPAKKKYSTKALASQLGVVIVSPKAKVSFKVSGPSKKICIKSGTKLRTLKAGNCVVTFTVQEPKPKKGKKPKATKTTTTFAVQ